MKRLGDALQVERPTPRWVVVVSVLVAIGTAVLGRHYGRESRQPEVDALTLERARLEVRLGDDPIVYEGVPYEVGEHALAHDHAEARFPSDRITWWVDPAGVDQIRPAVSLGQVRDAMRQAWALWADRLMIEAVEVQSEGEAMVRHRFAYIDGGSRTLAWSTLTEGDRRPQEQRYDTGETWTLGGPAPGQISLVVVACHEIGHAMGLGHDTPSSSAIMRPTYTAAIPKPTDRDVARMVGLGYRQRTEPKPLPPPDDALRVPAILSLTDVVNELRDRGYTVNPPPK